MIGSVVSDTTMTADANRAESMVCMDRAREALRNGDTEKAKRMLGKAKKLDPTQDIEFLLKKADSMGANSESSSRDSEERSYAHDDHYEEPNLRSRKTQNLRLEQRPIAELTETSLVQQKQGRRSLGHRHALLN